MWRGAGPPGGGSACAARRAVLRLSLALVAVSATAATTATAAAATASGATAAPEWVRGPASLVNPFAGTGVGGVSPGAISEFPGADVPFGMVQWSPDTSPDRLDGSGYDHADSHISGFSLTHLSGTGCAAYGDVPVLPSVGPITAVPSGLTEPFSHATESAAPGRYGVEVGEPGARVAVALTVTTRTGLGRFTFPPTAAANVVFKVAGSANPVSADAVRVVGDDEVTGQVTSGQFCQTGTPYTVFFAARFNRPFASAGTWAGGAVTPGATQCAGDSCGAWVTFDASRDRSVEMKVGISFVSVAGAQSNLAAEDPGWSLATVEQEATNRWNGLLERIRIAGGSPTEQRVFYTALYHSLLDPSVISDADGQYMGDDHLVHTSVRTQYSNFSEWDVYRCEIPLLSLVAPAQTADMMQSLVNDAQQNGWLPKWAIADGDASQMNGDSADPILADAYAFGVRDFDVGAALAAMVKGATEDETGHGLEIERQYLDQYLSQHYVDAGSLDLTSINYPIGGSVTLEYALDDFSIAQVAQALGDQDLYQSMMARAHNWEYLFNPATGYIEARNADGSFPTGPAFQSRLFEPGGENGFEEGNAIQYTWAVPQDLQALGDLMGGDHVAVAKLNRFFTRLNAGRFEPYDWSGNEPSLWTPWEYDSFGAPFRAQEVVRRIALTQYHDAPVDEPGNDDLGAISSWFVWAAMGLYPVTPGTANLALASPLFPAVSVELPSGHRLVLLAPGASDATPYVHSLALAAPSSALVGTGADACGPAVATASGPAGLARTDRGAGRGPREQWDRPWLPAGVLATGATLDFDLSSTPDPQWGAAPADAPPSYAAGRIPSVGFSLPAGGLTVPAGGSRAIELGVQGVSTGDGGVRWTATATPGLTVRPSSGSLAAVATAVPASASAVGQSCAAPPPVRTPLTVSAHSAGHGVVTVTLVGPGGVPLPDVVVEVDATA